MKIIAIGDIHWRDCRKEIVKQEYDKIVFMWDYFDTFKKTSCIEQYSNFAAILEFKKSNYHNVILLMGNHDYHYLSEVEEQYSWFQPVGKLLYPELLDQARRQCLLQAAYKHDDFLFSHAWISETWFNENKYGEEYKDDDISNINLLLLNEPERFWFYQGDVSHTWNNIHQSPIRIRPEALNEDMRWTCIQIVGHTTVKNIDISTPIVQIDALESWQYLIIQDGILSIWYLSWVQ